MMHKRLPISGIVAIASTTSCSSVKKWTLFLSVRFFLSMALLHESRRKSRTNVRFLVDSFVMAVYTYRWEVCQ